MLVCDEMRHRYYADATTSCGEDNPEQIFERVVQEGSLYATWAMPLYSVPTILVKTMPTVNEMSVPARSRIIQLHPTALTGSTVSGSFGERGRRWIH